MVEQTRTSREEAERVFLEHLGVIERAIHFACSRASMARDEAVDFASHAKLKLIENDYGVLRKFEQRCSFSRFIGIVIQRILLDYRVHLWGKWHASAEAKRLGEAAVMLEALLHRDGRSLNEAWPLLRQVQPDITVNEVESLADRLPRRQPRTRDIGLDVAEDLPRIPPESVDAGAFETERVVLSRSVAAVVRKTIDGFPEEDRLLLRLRFESEMTVAEISRAVGMEQKPLYRRIQRRLVELRQRLERSGVTAETVEQILDGRASDLDFGFTAISPPAPSSLTIGGEEGRIDRT